MANMYAKVSFNFNLHVFLLLITCSQFTNCQGKLVDSEKSFKGIKNDLQNELHNM